MRKIFVPDSIKLGGCVVFPTMKSYNLWWDVPSSKSKITIGNLKAGTYEVDEIISKVGVFDHIYNFAVRIYDTPQVHPNGTTYIGWAVVDEHFTVVD